MEKIVGQVYETGGVCRIPDVGPPEVGATRQQRPPLRWPAKKTCSLLINIFYPATYLRVYLELSPFLIRPLQVHPTYPLQSSPGHPRHSIRRLWRRDSWKFIRQINFPRDVHRDHYRTAWAALTLVKTPEDARPWSGPRESVGQPRECRWGRLAGLRVLERLLE